MTTLPVLPFRLETGIRWMARMLAALIIGVVLLIFIGEGGFDPLKLTAAEAVLMVLFLGTCIGMAVAWRWEMTGGAIASAGILLFFAVEFGTRGRFPNGLFFYLMLLTAILFVLSSLLRRRMSAS